MEILAWLIGAYFALCIGGYFTNRLFMYLPDPYRESPAEAGLASIDEIEIETPDGQRLVAWYAPASPGKPTVLYFHGNSGNAVSRASKIDITRRNGFGVLYLNNRGYGGSTGRPTEENNVADAITVYDYLTGSGVAPRDIFAYGESMGSGQAVRLAEEREMRAVVLEAPLTSTIDVGQKTYFWLPLSLIITDKFHNEKNVKRVHIPLLVLHGLRDKVIAVEQGKRVFAAANEPKTLELFREAGHADLFEHGAWEKVEAFVQGL